jgi:hypothetical protein
VLETLRGKEGDRAIVRMKPRSALTVLLLATSAPILLVIVMGLSAEVTYFSNRALLLMGFVYGGILAGIALTAVGTLYSRQSLTAVGAGLLIGESFPLLVDGLFVFTLLPAAVSLVLLKVKPTKSDLSITS